MKLIHCADLHLDSRMETNLTKEQAEERKKEILHTFLRMVDYARREGVEIILIAGDLFDEKKVSHRAGITFMDAVRNNPDIEFVLLQGNHDEDVREVVQVKTMPRNLKFFKDTWISYDYGEVVVTGCNDPYVSPEDLNLDHTRLNIVMLHGQVVPHLAEDGRISLNGYRHKYIDYMALGHLHTYKRERLDERGIWCYSGCLEGRGFDECGDKGFVLLEISRGELEDTFIPFADRCCHDLSVDVSRCEDSSAILNKVRYELEEISSRDMVKLRLTGEIDLDTSIDEDYFQEMLKDSFLLVKVLDETRTRIPRKTLRLDHSLRGELVRQVESSGLSREDQDKVLRIGLRALAGEEPME